ncbi:MAG: helix-turn-helix domain-containing protein [Clostridiales bacterium]|nr:helix-turn-helix domain-containing protein [Clostridiales bacterium]
MGKYMGTSEAGDKWGCHRDKVSKACREGKVEGAEQDGPGKPWRIPADAPNPFNK